MRKLSLGLSILIFAGCATPRRAEQPQAPAAPKTAAAATTHDQELAEQRLLQEALDFKNKSQVNYKIQPGDLDATIAESEVWGSRGVALIQLNDLEGSADAFQKADFDWATKAYPSPDFDDVYNMAYLAAQLGQADLARDLAAAHHRLVLRSDLPHLGAWDKYLCGMVAENFDTPQAVMGCLAGVEPGPLIVTVP